MSLVNTSSGAEGDAGLAVMFMNITPSGNATSFANDHDAALQALLRNGQSYSRFATLRDSRSPGALVANLPQRDITVIVSAYH